jgi:hypothetical protein
LSSRYLLDEDLSSRVAEGLRRLGIDAVSVHEVGRSDARIPDELQLQYAVSEGRAIVSFNREDFQRLDREWRESGRHHQGIVWGHESMVRRRDVGGIIPAIQAIDQTYDDLSDLIIPLARSE